MVIHEMAQCREGFGPGEKDFARATINDEIDIALAISRLGVVQAVELVGQGSE